MRSTSRLEIAGLITAILLGILLIVVGIWWVSRCVELPYALLLALYWTYVNDSQIRYSLPRWLRSFFFFAAPVQIILASTPFISFSAAYVLLFSCIAALAALSFLYHKSLYWSWRIEGGSGSDYNNFYEWFSGGSDEKAFTLRQALRQYWEPLGKKNTAPKSCEQVLRYWEEGGYQNLLHNFVREYARFRAYNPEFYTEGSTMQRLESTFFRLWIADTDFRLFAVENAEEESQALAPFAFELVGQAENLQKMLDYARQNAKMRIELEAILPLSLIHLEQFMEEQSPRMVEFFRAPQRLEEVEKVLSDCIPAIGLPEKEQISEQLAQQYGLYYMAIGIAQNCA